MPRHGCLEMDWRGGHVLFGRTGYTGEDGGECVDGHERGDASGTRSSRSGVTPAGLGARDTLRLEAALPLHGHDISTETNRTRRASAGRLA